jgi:hypothetical protein
MLFIMDETRVFPYEDRRQYVFMLHLKMLPPHGSGVFSSPPFSM